MACLASFVILAGGLSLIYGLGWYKDRKFKRRITRRVKTIDYLLNKLQLTNQLTINQLKMNSHISIHDH